MKHIGVKLFVFMGIFFCVAGTAMAEKEIVIDCKLTIDEDRLHEIVKDIIRDNPKLLFDTINNYAKEQKKQKNAKKLEDSFKNRLKGIAPDAHTPVKGPEDAVITIVEFSEFQCPYCRKVNKTVDNLMKKYPGKIRLAFKNNPLKFHDQAIPAANAAMAAHKQGEFWEYHNRLFEKSSELNEELFVNIAQDMGLDMNKFNEDRNSDEIASQVLADKAQAEANNLRGTPAFVANGVVIQGAQNINYFTKVINRLLKELKQKELKQKEE